MRKQNICWQIQQTNDFIRRNGVRNFYLNYSILCAAESIVGFLWFHLFSFLIWRLLNSLFVIFFSTCDSFIQLFFHSKPDTWELPVGRLIDLTCFFTGHFTVSAFAIALCVCLFIPFYFQLLECRGTKFISRQLFRWRA